MPPPGRKSSGGKKAARVEESDDSDGDDLQLPKYGDIQPEYLNQPVNQKQGESKLKTLIGELAALSQSLKQSADNLTEVAGDLAESLKQDDNAPFDYDNLPEDPVSLSSTASAILELTRLEATTGRDQAARQRAPRGARQDVRGLCSSKGSQRHATTHSPGLPDCELARRRPSSEADPFYCSSQADIFDVYEKRTEGPLAERAKMTTRQRFMEDDVYTGFRSLVFVRLLLSPSLPSELTLLYNRRRSTTAKQYRA